MRCASSCVAPCPAYNIFLVSFQWAPPTVKLTAKHKFCRLKVPQWLKVAAQTVLWMRGDVSEAPEGIAGSAAAAAPPPPDAATYNTLFRLHAGAPARHLGLLALREAGPSFIHAYERHGVVESPLTPPWARRIAACFALTERIG